LRISFSILISRILLSNFSFFFWTSAIFSLIYVKY
jgi:hypothetical protein